MAGLWETWEPVEARATKGGRWQLAWMKPGSLDLVTIRRAGAIRRLAGLELAGAQRAFENAGGIVPREGPHVCVLLTDGGHRVLPVSSHVRELTGGPNLGRLGDEYPGRVPKELKAKARKLAAKIQNGRT